MYLHLDQTLKVALGLIVPVLALLSLYRDLENNLDGGLSRGCIRSVFYLF